MTDKLNNPMAYAEALEIKLQILTEHMETVNARNVALLRGLVDARELVSEWGSYAPDWAQKKHDLKGDLARLQKIIDHG